MSSISFLGKSIMAQQLRVIFLSIFLSLPARHDCLAIRARRSLPNDQEVIDAIDVLQRAGLGRPEPLRNSARAYPAELVNQLIDSSMMMDDSVLSSRESNDDYEDDLMQINPDAEPGQSIAGYENEDEEEREEEEREEDKKEDKRVLEKRPVDKEELQGLFQPTPEAVIETAAIGTEIVKSETTDGDKEKIVRSEIVKLLSDDGTSGDPNGKIVGVGKVETEESKPENDGVIRKTQRTEWIFKPDIEDGMDFYPRPDGLPGGLANKEWLIDLADGNGGRDYSGAKSSAKPISMKKKRSSEPPPGITPPADLGGPLGLKNEAVELLKVYIEQQEDENRHLARALNLATLSQVGSTDQYLEEEIDEIKRAAQNEKILETLREVLTLASQNGADASELSNIRLRFLEPNLRRIPELEGDFEEPMRKRRDSVRKTVPESWSEPSVLAEQISAEVEEANDDDDDIDDVIKNKLRELLIKAGEEGEVREDTRAVPPEAIINEYNRYRLNPFLRDIYEVESGAPAGLLPYGERYSEPDGVCDAVEVLADDCMAARSRNLMLDSEATDLCDRHKLCYKCGSYFGMTPDKCDRGYMNEAAVACSLQKDSDVCHEDALALYAIMIRQQTPLSPVTYPAAPAECSSPCVYAYIVGMDRRRRR